jgi:hypothetical protein
LGFLFGLLKGWGVDRLLGGVPQSGANATNQGGRDRQQLECGLPGFGFFNVLHCNLLREHSPNAAIVEAQFASC